jgi:hypothetical protein
VSVGCFNVVWQFNYLGADPWEIGVIAPYRAQVRTIRKLLKLADLAKVEVGSVEQFQGQVRAKQRLRERDSSTDSCALSSRNEES